MERSYSWAAVLVASLSVRTQGALTEVRDALGPDLVAQVRLGERVPLDSKAIRCVQAAAAEASELADQLASLADALPGEGLVVDDEDAGVGAGGDLLEGISDSARAELAAEMLDLQPGCVALAEALRTNESRQEWQDVTVESFISRFRGSTETVAAEIVNKTGIAPRTPFADASHEEIERLATVLEQFAGEQRP